MLWSENWDRLDIHLQLTTLFQKMEGYCSASLVEFLKNPENADQDLYNAIIHYWTGAQIQVVSKACPTIFSQTPKQKSQKSKEYRSLLDQFMSANFRELHASVEDTPECLTSVSLPDALRIPSQQSFDVTIILDADAISTAETLPILLSTKKAISVLPSPFQAIYQLSLGVLMVMQIPNLKILALKIL